MDKKVANFSHIYFHESRNKLDMTQEFFKHYNGFYDAGTQWIATMLALIIGGNIFGLSGMLLAIPTAAIMKSLLLDLRDEIQTIESS